MGGEIIIDDILFVAQYIKVLPVSHQRIQRILSESNTFIKSDDHNKRTENFLYVHSTI